MVSSQVDGLARIPGHDKDHPTRPNFPTIAPNF